MSLSRRTILIAAACSVASTAHAASRDVQVWRGFALGADAEIRIAGVASQQAMEIISLATAEIERLETIFSLYRPESELSRLNRYGSLESPSHDMRLLIERSLQFWEWTGGSFNPAIQPLWRFLAQHFENYTTAPDLRVLAEILPRCDPSRITNKDGRITLERGMALTFNGIAQGYITDRIANLFRARGLQDILINLGEIRALPGRPWSVDVAGIAVQYPLQDGAIAQSAGRGTAFSPDGRWHHLIDPASGRSANHVAAVTVAAATALEADALSTALFIVSPSRHAAIAQRFSNTRYWIEPLPA